MHRRHVASVLVAKQLDPRDPLLHSERTQGFTADPVYAKGEVFVYVGSIQNLKDLKRRAFVARSAPLHSRQSPLSHPLSRESVQCTELPHLKENAPP